jgi:hypothetical protein
MINFFKKRTLRSEWEALQKKYDIKRSILMLETPNTKEKEKHEYTVIISGTEQYDVTKFSKLFSAALNISKTLWSIIDCMNQQALENMVNAFVKSQEQAKEAKKQEELDRKARKRWN